MLQFIWSCLESGAEKIGLETVASLLAVLLTGDSMTAGRFVADVVLLTILITAVEKGRDIAKKDFRLMLCLLLMGVVGITSLFASWVNSGANPDIHISELVRGAAFYFVGPWLIIFVLLPLLLVAMVLWDQYVALGGSTTSPLKQLGCYGLLLGFIWLIGDQLVGSGLPQWVLWSAAGLLALIPTLVVLIWFAFQKRSKSRLLLTGVRRWEFKQSRKSFWAAPHEMDEVQFRAIRKRLKSWTQARLASSRSLTGKK